jgi:magnesium chelatase family protein
MCGAPALCTPLMVERYAARVSGPILDRIDLHVGVPPVDFAALSADAPGEPTAAVKERVIEARARQARRLGAGVTNATMLPAQTRATARLTAAAQRAMAAAAREHAISARAWDRIVRVSRTIADLAGAGPIDAAHVEEAAMFHSGVA